MALRAVSFVSCLVLSAMLWTDPSCATRIVKPESGTAKVSVSEGGTIQLVCVSNETMAWKANGVAVQPVEGHTRIVEENSTQLMGSETMQNTLTVSNVKPTDTGTYACRDVSDTLGTDSAEIDIKVVKAAKLQITIFGNTTGARSVAEGGELNLRCVGEYRSTPGWTHNGKELQDGKEGIVINVETKAETNTKTSLLTREGVTQSVDGGTYKCVDSAQYQTDSDDFVVTISVEPTPSQAVVATASGILVMLSMALIAVLNDLFKW